MTQPVNRYKQFEKNMTSFLILALVLFLIFLIAAAEGIIWLKVIFAILCVLLSVAILGFLYLTQELARPRSLWMTVGAVSILVCLLVSLLLNYPAP